MYPYISDLINDLLGTSIRLPAKTFGFFLAMAFVVAYFVIKRELARREKLGQFRLRTEKIRLQGPMSKFELFGQPVLWGIVGYKLGYMFVDYDRFYGATDQVLLSTEGFWLTGLLALGIAGFLKYRKNEQTKDLEEKFQEVKVGPSYFMGQIVTLAFIGGILGAKIFALVEDPPTTFIGFLKALVSFDGLAFLGGLICASALILWYVNRKGFNAWKILDAAVPALILAYAVGRIGCQMSGDGDWGMPNIAPQPDWLAWLPDWTWSFDYPGNVAYPNPGTSFGCDTGPEYCNHVVEIVNCTRDEYCTRLAKPAWPTPFYETMMGFGIFGILWAIRKRLKFTGQLLSIYLMFIGLERFLIEFIRVNERYDFLGMTLSQAQIIALFMILGGIGLFVWRTSKKQPKVIPAAAEN